MKIAISAESTVDLSRELLEKYDIKVISFEIVLGAEPYKSEDVSAEKVIEFAEKSKTLPKTTALNEFMYTEFFEKLRKDYDAVVHICLSGGITSSCNNAKQAGEKIDGVYVVDSRTLSTGIGMLAIYARKLADKGFSPEEIAKKVSDRAGKLESTFMIERLDFLYKGGRCNSLQLLGANLLRLRPRIILKDGKMTSDRKYRGSMEHVIGKYCDDLFAEFDKPDLDTAFITYTTATEGMISSARQACEKRGFKNIYEERAGATIACHCGANTLGIFYFNDNGEAD